MNNYFYYFGFFYLIDILIALYKDFNPSKTEQVYEINEKMDIGEIMNVKEKIDSKIKNIEYYFVKFFGFTCFIWGVIGYLANTPEKNWFLLLVASIITYYIIFLSFSIAIVFKAFLGNKAKVYNEEKKPTVSIPLSKIISTIELMIVSYILYHHFFIQ